MARITVLWMSNRSATCLEAGAIIDEDTGLMNVNADTIRIALHFLLKLQLYARNHSGRTGKGDVKHTFLDFLGHLDHPNQQ